MSESPLKLEAQVCPRRKSSSGPFKGVGEDQWLIGDWLSRTSYWPTTDRHPRCCSFCGGIHPDDAIRLVQAGWDVIGTNKSYKRFLEPPGLFEASKAAIKTYRKTGKLVKEKIRNPDPKVVLFTYHFSIKQAESFNDSLENRPCP